MEETITIEADQDGNFDTPVLQLLYDTWEAYEAEEIEEDEVKQVLAEVDSLTRTQLAEMEADAKRPEVDVHDPNRVAILLSFQAHLDGVERMRGFFEGGSADLIDEGFDVIHEATNKMMDSLQGLLQSEEDAAPKLCVQCSEPNDKYATICSNCNARLPVVEEPDQGRLISVEGPQGETEEQTTTPNYIEISEAHEAWTDEGISTDRFLAVVEGVKQNHLADQSEASKALESLLEDDSEEKEFERQYLQQLLVILDQNVSALDQLSRALTEGDFEGVEDAMFSVADATVAILT